MIRLQAISRNGFWFKTKADSGFKPKAYTCTSRILNPDPTQRLGQKTFLGWLVVSCLVILSAIFFTADGALASQRMAVKSDVANIRARPDTASDVLWQVEKYYPLVILEEKDSWYRFKDFEGDVGWIHSSLVDDTPTVIVKVNRANIRSDSGTQYNLLFDAERGTPFKVLEKKGRWIKVEHADGDVGWIFNSLVW